MSELTAESCRQLLSRYETALASRIDQHRSKNGAKNLLELDSWRLNELSKVVRERNPSYMTKDELTKLIECKLSRGKFRPRLQQLVSSNSTVDVRSQSESAFAELSEPITVPSIIAAVKALSKLKGVGPATATLVLQAKADSIPFMSDEAMVQVLRCDKKNLKYDLKVCKVFVEKIFDIVKSLKDEFSAAEIERALFVHDVVGSQDGPNNALSTPISPTPKKDKKKRGAPEEAEKNDVKKAKVKSRSRSTRKAG